MKNNKDGKLTNTLKVMTILSYGVCFLIGAVLVANILRSFPAAKNAIVSTVCALLGSYGLLFVLMTIMKRRMTVKRSIRSLEVISEKLTSMAIVWNTSFTYFYVNPEFIRLTGYTAKDLENPEILRKVLPEDAFSSNLQAIINNRDEEYSIRCADGKNVRTMWSTSLMTVVKNRKDEDMIMLSIGPDLTETYRMQSEIKAIAEKLTVAEKRYSLSMDLSEIGLLLKDNGSSRYYASDMLCNMLGLAPDKDGYVDGGDIRAAIHPKDRVVFDNFASKAAENADSDSDGHSVEFRAVSVDGTYHWYNFRYKNVAGGGNISAGGAVIDISEDKEKDLIIEKMAYVDEVTGIYNRNKFMMTGSEVISCVRSDSSVNYWVIVFDVDNFHIINDTCGYATGNRLLKEIASVLTANISESGFAARIGGDNFALIVKADGDDDTPVRLIRSIQRDIANISGSGLENQTITCSAGYCLMTDGDAEDFSHVLDHAEFALSLSDDTRSTIDRFDNSAHDTVIAGNELEKNLVKAIENNELVLFYQPKINLVNGKVMGMEALIRWIKPDGTVVPPCDFIPVAERSLLITKISEFVLHEACRQNKAWQDMGLEPVTVSINLTATDFYQTNVTESIREVLEATGLDPQWLDVELTESLALKDIDHAVKQMQEIKDLGVKLSMDDFGTGYSSLSYIQILPITLLKLDRSFVMYLEEDEISREIVSAVIRIAKTKRIETIAEGIETIEQAEILKHSGCDHAQGYFFGKPMPADKFEEFLKSRQGKAYSVK